eukprot:g5731.t1
MFTTSFFLVSALCSVCSCFGSPHDIVLLCHLRCCLVASRDDTVAAMQSTWTDSQAAGATVEAMQERNKARRFLLFDTWLN